MRHTSSNFAYRFSLSRMLLLPVQVMSYFDLHRMLLPAISLGPHDAVTVKLNTFRTARLKALLFMIITYERVSYQVQSSFDQVACPSQSAASVQSSKAASYLPMLTFVETASANRESRRLSLSRSRSYASCRHVRHGLNAPTDVDDRSDTCWQAPFGHCSRYQRPVQHATGRSKVEREVETLPGESRPCWKTIRSHFELLGSCAIYKHES